MDDKHLTEMTAPAMTFRHLKAGDHVVRMLAGVLRVPMVVQTVEDEIIRCAKLEANGSVTPWTWTFDRETGVEEDHELGFGRKFGMTGSFLVLDH